MIRTHTIIPKAADGELRVALNGRISTVGQDFENIEASFIPLKALLAESWKGTIKFEYYAEQSSGENVNRPELKRLEAQITTGVLDLTAAEDLGRYARDPAALWHLLNLCEKYKVRVLCPGDGLDTADPNWQSVAHAAIAKHCGFLQDTRRRIKRTASKKFAEGGHAIHAIPGYRKLSLAEAAARVDVPGLRLELIKECQTIVDDARRKIVLERYSYAMLADHFNTIGFKPGPRVESGLWTGDLVKTWLHSTLLWGKRQFRVELSGRDPIDKTKTITLNPTPEEQHYSVLAFMTEEEFLEMHRVLDGYAIHQAQGEASGAVRRRKGVPRRTTLFPKQHVQCAICNGYYYDAANGGFRCGNGVRGARRECWCHMQIRLKVLVTTLIDWLIGVLTSGPPGVMDRFMDVAFEQLQKLQSCHHEDIAALRDRIAGHKRTIASLIKCSGMTTDEQVMARYVAQVETHNQEVNKAEIEIAGIEESMKAEHRPQTKEQLITDPRASLLDLAANSFEFAVFMRRIVPTIIAQPLQAIDSGLMRPRLQIELNLSALVESMGVSLPIERYTIDAFDEAQHFRDRSLVVDARAAMEAEGANGGAATIAVRLGIGKMRASRALRLHRLMVAEGLSEPYRAVTKPVPASRQKKRSSKVNLAVAT